MTKIEKKILDMVAQLHAAGGQPTEEALVNLAVAAFDELMNDELAKSLAQLDGQPESVKAVYRSSFQQSYDDAKSTWLPGIIVAARRLAANSKDSIDVRATVATSPTIH
ncbi:hypothetical protein [Achromobacter animicus]|uniref:hypothetical protein n=1 Tax=Achromobacter animicus TaxID=1389935 RepID=UPI0014666C76|nr:hypothetical protein [Achromobacter animicus]CAB3901231.1 hypothetical protein LMG26691_04501 [Achromobacter animicus]